MKKLVLWARMPKYVFGVEMINAQFICILINGGEGTCRERRKFLNNVQRVSLFCHDRVASETNIRGMKNQMDDREYP